MYVNIYSEALLSHRNVSKQEQKLLFASITKWVGCFQTRTSKQGIKGLYYAP